MARSLRYINYLKIYGTAGAVLGLVPGTAPVVFIFCQHIYFLMLLADPTSVEKSAKWKIWSVC